jgi:hypothetical protein
VPRQHKVDRPATRMMLREGYFADPKSFVSLPGDDGESHVFLGKKDWDRQKLRVFERDKCCVRCGQGPRVGCPRLDPHHIVRKSKGGSDDMANVQILCDECHKTKHPEKRVRFGESRPQATQEFIQITEEGESHNEQHGTGKEQH